MPLNPAMWAMTLTELALWITLAILFWRKKLQMRFPAMGWYLILRALSAPLLFAILYIQSQPWGRLWYAVYFFTYWAVYIASSAFLFFVSLEIFRSALAGFSGLIRFGTVIFRWAAVVSVITSLSTISLAHVDLMLLPTFAYKLMSAVSVIELCLLAFLCLSMNALRLSVRNLGFGIALGLGILSSSDFILAAVLSHNSKIALTAPVQFISEGILLFALGIWIVFTALPEPAREPIVVPANSTIYRWNEIASALGHKGTHVAVQQPATSFFLTDVEKVVEKVLTRSSLQESKSNS
jgi:hypothetical protein